MTPGQSIHTDNLRFLSIDVEDCVIAAADFCFKKAPAEYEDNLASDLRRTLEVLEKTKSSATFFFNARYCKKHHELVREIVSRGHVLASHGYYHHDVRRLSVEQFREDVERSIEVLSKYQDVILGYRPPAYTMPFDQAHLSVLLDCGIRYLSCGAAFKRTNIPHCESPVRLDCGLVYIPVTVSYYFGKRIRYPIGYGNAARLLPERFYLASLRRRLLKSDFFQFYFHPFELNGINGYQKKYLLRTMLRGAKQFIYAQRCGDRSKLFEQIFNTCRFQPLETLEALSVDRKMENRFHSFR